jgi:hypothetical protein
LFKLSRVAIPCKERANYLNFAYQNGIFYWKSLQKLQYECVIIIIKIFQSAQTKL